ncbi:hypothetical protein KJ359_000007 [Pestalotiopsis sp. 9143b]|nr:hypothetical protein KJ359_000007 [Pestalotiopsis sp. 9143b]
MYRGDEESPTPPPGRRRASTQNTLTDNAWKDTGDKLTGSHVVTRCPEDTMSMDYSMDDTSPFSEPYALLLRNFTDHMAQWTDIADPFRTFENVVSRLAMTDLVVRTAICAFSARHFYRCQDDEDGDAKALDYQNRCLQLLIPSMSGGQKITESILTAVALLRQNEEMDGE